MNIRTCMRAAIVSALAISQLGAGPAMAMGGESTKTEEYGKSGDWILRRTIAGSEVVACDMFNLTGSELGLRFGYNKEGGSLGFSALGSAASEGPLEVEMWFDDRKADSQIVSMPLENDASDYPWRSYSAPNTEPDGVLDDAVLNSGKVSFAYNVPGEGIHTETFSLKGYQAASIKTTECVNNPKPVAKAKATPAAAAPSGPKVIKGTCKLVVDGKTYVDIKGTCPIWMANDGTGTFWINADRETYLGDYFAEIMPAGNGTASGNWNGEKGATHAQSFLGEDFKQGKGGCWSNKRATICAAK